MGFVPKGNSQGGDIMPYLLEELMRDLRLWAKDQGKFDSLPIMG